MRLDFSQWHPLDHWPWMRRCREHYGGWRHHLSLTWDFRRRDQVYGWFARWTTCFLGHHSWQVWRTARGPALVPDQLGAPSDYRALCRYCPVDRTATEDEWW